MKEINIKSFDKTIAKGTVVVDVWMENCPNCVEYDPIFAAVAEENPDITFAKFLLNPKDLTTEWKNKYFKLKAGESLKAPATLVFNDGKMAKRKFGMMTKEDLIDLLLVKTLDELYIEKGKQISIMHASSKIMQELDRKNPEELKDEDYLARGKAATNQEIAQFTILKKLNPQIEIMLNTEK